MFKKVLTVIVILVVVALVIVLFASRGSDKINISSDRDSPIFNFGGDPENKNDTAATSGEGGFPSGGQESKEPTTAEIPQLRRVSFKEISGYGVFDVGGTTTVRFVDRESGNVFETNTKTLNTTRVTNTTVLKTNNSWWFDKNNFLLRYVDEGGIVKTFLAEIPQPETGNGDPVELGGTFLENNISDLSVFGDEAFYLKSGGDGSVGVIYKIKSDDSETVLSTPLREITPNFYNRDFISINTKPSYSANGSLFIVDKSVGLLSEVVGGENGLYGVPAEDGSKILYSRSENRGVSSWITGPGLETKRLEKDTLADKCVWFKSTVVYCAVPKNLSQRNLPDEWYKGNLSFADEIWSIDTNTGESKLLSDPLIVSSTQIDAVDIQVDAAGENLFFINKINGGLWSLSLEGAEVSQSSPDNE